VILGTTTNIKEVCAELDYTYFLIRTRMNPLIYGIKWDEVVAYPILNFKQGSLVIDIAHSLIKQN